MRTTSSHDLPSPHPPASRGAKALGRHRLLTGLLAIGILAAPSSFAQEPQSARYLVHFQSTWSASSHPIDFPTNPALLTAGGYHPRCDDLVLVPLGRSPAPGWKRWPSGARHHLSIWSSRRQSLPGHASEVLIGPNLRPSPGSRTMELEVTRDHPLVTLVTMLAPSPDWFVGVSGLSLLDGNDWVDTRIVTLFAYDAGTDSGVTYTSTNANTNPPQPIHLAAEGPFSGGQPVGTFTFVRQQTAPPMPLFLRENRFRIDVNWRNHVGLPGVGLPVQLTPETGYFWFFDESNVETLVKVLDGCANNGHYWVFLAGLTDVEVEITVEDTLTKQFSFYRNELGEPFPPMLDTKAFASCP